MLVPQEVIANKIFLIRGKKVMLDKDLARLYGVTTGNLNKAVKRNRERFPEDFMFRLTKKEANSLRFQFGSLKRGQHPKYLPYAFTDYGILMLSSVLKSEQAIQVNIQIMRAFIKMREMLFNYKDLQQKIEQMEKKYDQQFRMVFETIKQLIEEEQKPRRKMGVYG